MNSIILTIATVAGIISIMIGIIDNTNKIFNPYNFLFEIIFAVLATSMLFAYMLINPWWLPVVNTCLWILILFLDLAKAKYYRWRDDDEDGGRYAI